MIPSEQLPGASVTAYGASAATKDASLPLRAPRVAYFTMEVGLSADIPTYSGGLGILAGDTLRSAADLGVPMVGVTLMHRKGYFRQVLDKQGNQSEVPIDWKPEEFFQKMDGEVTVTLESRPVSLRAWRYLITGVNGHIVPVYFLDAGVESNSEWDQSLTNQLYGGDQHYRLCQEFILGVGGVEMLERLGHTDIETYHMNEGHSALLVLPLIEKEIRAADRPFPVEKDLAAIRRKCVFTTHTPIPAGHDEFPGDMVRRALGEDRSVRLFSSGFTGHDHLNMTHLALHHSNYVNGVAMRHGQVSRTMFPNYRIKALTNGVHASSWVSPPMRELFDREIPEWRHDNIYLRYGINIAQSEILSAHARAKRELLGAIKEAHGYDLDEKVFTIGFARRATGYKRADLLFRDIDRLKKLVEKTGPLQIVYGGKAHPKDQGGKDLIRRVFQAAEQLKDAVKIIYVENYNYYWGGLITSGVDIWLNTPEKTREASGTSGMKAALNGVPSLSILDGWWIEGHLEGVTGWSIEEGSGGEQAAADSIYKKLEETILPLYYNRPNDYALIMRSAIALNGSFFNTQRMLLQYIFNAYSTNSSK
jgi:starch phosphorylase